jgi:sugar lactone lactonase YvrE
MPKIITPTLVRSATALLLGICLTHTASIYAAEGTEHASHNAMGHTGAGHTKAAPAKAAKLWKKTPFLKGLDEPQGLAIAKDGTILLCDYGSGDILRYSKAGKLLGKIASGLKSPAQIVVRGNDVFVSERKANRIIKITAGGKVWPVGGPIEQPLGLTLNAAGELVTLSHTASKVYRFDGKAWKLFYTAPNDASGEQHYGYRCLAYDGAFLLSDEDSEQVLVLTPGGRLATWASHIANPSGITIGPDRATYVCSEDNDGQLLRLNAQGKATIVAEGLGRARNVLFLDRTTALISDRDGNVWKLTTQ